MTRLDNFWNFLVTKLFGLFWKTSILSQICCDYFLATFVKKLGYFLIRTSGHSDGGITDTWNIISRIDDDRKDNFLSSGRFDVFRKTYFVDENFDFKYDRLDKCIWWMVMPKFYSKSGRISFAVSSAPTPCSAGFKSHAHHLRFFQFIIFELLLEWEVKKINRMVMKWSACLISTPSSNPAIVFILYNCLKRTKIKETENGPS